MLYSSIFCGFNPQSNCFFFVERMYPINIPALTRLWRCDQNLNLASPAPKILHKVLISQKWIVSKENVPDLVSLCSFSLEIVATPKNLVLLYSTAAIHHDFVDKLQSWQFRFNPQSDFPVLWKYSSLDEALTVRPKLKLGLPRPSTTSQGVDFPEMDCI